MSAVWLREAILGDEVAPPPADVTALSDTASESADHAVSIKDLLEKHRTQESCNDCHVRLDPWGIPFEEYNGISVDQGAAAIRGGTTRYSSIILGTEGGTDSQVGHCRRLQILITHPECPIPHGISRLNPCLKPVSENPSPVSPSRSG